MVFVGFVFFFGDVVAQTHFSMEELNSQKSEAINKEYFRLAKIIQDEINLRNSVDYNPDEAEWSKDSVLKAEVDKLEAEEKYAAKMGYWSIAAKLKEDADLKKGGTKEEPLETIAEMAASSGLSVATVFNNERETYLQKVKKEGFGVPTSPAGASSGSSSSVSDSGALTGKVRSAEDNKTAEMRYRRSSLYTMMIHNPMRNYENVIVDAFGNAPLPNKFNDHNVGLYLITEQSGADDQSWAISQ